MLTLSVSILTTEPKSSLRQGADALVSILTNEPKSSLRQGRHSIDYIFS